MTNGAESTSGTKPTRKAFVRDLFNDTLAVFIHALIQFISGSCQSQANASRSRSPQQQINRENECHSCGELALCFATANMGRLTSVRGIFLVRAGQIEIGERAGNPPKQGSSRRLGVLFLPPWKKCGGNLRSAR
jgi:hypothetical protein